jgi:hypothetical protein
MQFFERRKDPRTQHQGQALVAGAQSAVLVQIADVSKSGCCVKRPRGWNFNIGDAVRVYLFNGPGPAMCLEARVVWYRDDEIGCQYLN